MLFKDCLYFGSCIPTSMYELVVYNEKETSDSSESKRETIDFFTEMKSLRPN